MPRKVPVEVEPGEFRLESVAGSRFPTRYEPHARSEIKGVRFPKEEGRTVQDAKDECDINLIMKRYVKSGVLPPTVGVGRYGDFSAAEDFLHAQAVILNAKAQFDSLPSHVRERFKNNPAEMLAFLGNVDNLEEAKKLGLLKDEEPRKDNVVTPPPVEKKE